MDSRFKTVLITSALPSEGKTTVATNLSLALARHGSTCLIDADLPSSIHHAVLWIVSGPRVCKTCSRARTTG